MKQPIEHSANGVKFLLVDELPFEMMCMADFFGVLPSRFSKCKPYKVIGIASELPEEQAMKVARDILKKPIDTAKGCIDTLCQSHQLNPSTTIIVKIESRE